MKSRLVVEENTVYEIDEECLRRRQMQGKRYDNYSKPGEIASEDCKSCRRKFDSQNVEGQSFMADGYK
ncbi:MAG: hypothetical protein IJM37_04000 [Lachnospiraceae bacterium]|nr:hypothetical protein [Lachnospiraceae bacterium]